MLLQAMTKPATPFASADARWDAFIGRNAAADGRFVAAVMTTGIYCRPSCPARKPKRENVRFYAAPAARGFGGAGAMPMPWPRPAVSSPRPRSCPAWRSWRRRRA